MILHVLWCTEVQSSSLKVSALTNGLWGSNKLSWFSNQIGENTSCLEIDKRLYNTYEDRHSKEIIYPPASGAFMIHDELQTFQILHLDSYITNKTIQFRKGEIQPG